MSIEENRALVRFFYDEVYNKRNLDVSDGIIDPTFRSNTLERGGEPTGDGFRVFINKLLTAFPDARVTVDDVIAEDDKVVARWTLRGTHLGQFYVAPTGKPITTTAIDIFRIAHGKFVERWPERDRLGLLQQLGVAPQPQ